MWAFVKESVLEGSFPKASFLAVQMSLGLALARKSSHDFLLADWMALKNDFWVVFLSSWSSDLRFLFRCAEEVVEDASFFG
jgi:hypothetical protein